MLCMFPPQIWSLPCLTEKTRAIYICLILVSKRLSETHMKINCQKVLVFAELNTIYMYAAHFIKTMITLPSAVSLNPTHMAQKKCLANT